ncbi:MAG: FAD-binding oxidoreductase [Acetobacteraceae bacterium]|nr:FAD-binding oxidoreductase [Acetobacteraceae bacterium]
MIGRLLAGNRHDTTGSLYPLGDDGAPIANYVQVPTGGHPCFAAEPYGAGLPAQADVVVVGAGYTGVSAALHLGLLRRAAGSDAAVLLLLEAGRVGSGPSGKSGGHVCSLQVPDEAVLHHCGRELGRRVITAAGGAVALVRSLAVGHGIPCDLRDGYIEIGRDGQSLVEDGSLFGIDPYPYVLGLAHAARALGVGIREGVHVVDIDEGRDGCRLTTSAGTVSARFVLAAGGHRMAEDIPLLAPLRRRTAEVRVGTIVTDPLPHPVLLSIMPVAGGRRLPFATHEVDVYGSVARGNRIAFGAGATAWADPDPARIARRLHRVFPSLGAGYRAAIGRPLGWRTLVRSEQLCFTRDFLPNVGIAGRHRKVLYVQALGGHGIALGTLLGKAAADRIWSAMAGLPEQDGLFEVFAAVPHGWLPAWPPARKSVAAMGLRLHEWWLA